jgi:hypothetical protein
LNKTFTTHPTRNPSNVDEKKAHIMIRAPVMPLEMIKGTIMLVAKTPGGANSFGVVGLLGLDIV